MKAAVAVAAGGRRVAWRFRFDEWELRPDEHRLLRAGAEVALTGRAFAVLRALVERGGQLLTRDELLSRVWAGVVVEDNNLAVQVAALRRVVGSDAISTIPGVGYRFSRAVERERVADDATEPNGDALAGADAASPLPERGNLPLRLPRLVGRERERRQLEDAIAASPIVTLCGGPGLGKTRLARAVAQGLQPRFADGVYWVDLVPLPPEREGADGTGDADARGAAALDPPAADAAVLAAVHAAMSLRAGDPGDGVGSLARRLKSSAVLLVLDNAEHVVGAVSRFATALVGATSQVALLVTSQRPLQSPLELLVRLDPLALPAPGADVAGLRASDAVHLLAERARQLDHPLPDTEDALRLAAAQRLKSKR